MNIYPEEHIGLADEISKKGAVISEFPMRTIPDRGNFPKRNRIISGLSLGVVVVEAAAKSGALITSDTAIEQGREVFAIPGKIDSVTSKGAHRLLKEGAKIAENADDILEELRLEITVDSQENKKNLSPLLDKQGTLVYNLLSNEPKHIDDLADESGISVTELSRELLNLELKKLARQLSGKNFVKGAN